MDYPSRRYFSNSSSEPSEIVVLSNLEQRNWTNNMHAHQALNGKLKAARIITKDDKHPNFGLFATEKVDKMQEQPKKDNMLQSMYKKMTSHFTANVSNPLSVTLVSPDLYKSLQQPLGNIDQPQHLQFAAYCSGGNPQSSYVGGDETLQCATAVFSTGHNSDSDSKINLSDCNDSEKRWRDYKNLFVDCSIAKEKSESEDKSEGIGDRSEPFTIIENSCDKDQIDTSAIFGTRESIYFPTAFEKPTTTPPKSTETLLSPVSSLITNACNKMVNGLVSSVTELFRTACATEEENNQSLFIKHSGTSPKPRRKRVISKRVKGKAKPQLRRSGVSQTRHRKHQNFEEQKRCELDSWDEFDNSEDDAYDEVDCGVINRNLTFTLADVPAVVAKPKKAKIPYAQVSVSIKSFDDQVFAKETVRLRPRSISESSVDSEDSYCIVFEGPDCDDSTETDEETEFEDDTLSNNSDDTDVIYNKLPSKSKVRFNMNPVVYPMIKWNYAYKAARRGPWEEMARDRIRFQDRVKNLSRIIDPVLRDQHRARIYRERFDEVTV